MLVDIVGNSSQLYW